LAWRSATSASTVRCLSIFRICHCELANLHGRSLAGGTDVFLKNIQTADSAFGDKVKWAALWCIAMAACSGNRIGSMAR